LVNKPQNKELFMLRKIKLNKRNLIYFINNKNFLHQILNRSSGINPNDFCNPNELDLLYFNSVKLGYVANAANIRENRMLLNSVSLYPYCLSYIETQTEELCLAAVKQNVCALKWVKHQDEGVCLAAVQQDGLALKWVNAQTEAICLAAVQNYGGALEYVKKQTEAICLAAVKYDGYALYYVKEQTEEICLAAVQNDSGALQYVKDNELKQEIKAKLKW
jgi:hypothetical protein